MLPINLTIVDDDSNPLAEEIYTRYEKQLYLIAMKYLKDHHDAQDCVHNTVTIIIQGIEKFEIANDFGYIEKMIGVVCRNCALNMFREKKRRYQYEQSLSRYNYEEGEYEEIDICDYESYVDKMYISEQNCEYLHNLINKLDEKYRDIVLLKSLGVENKSIASMMNISEDLVRKRYSRAKKQLWKMGGKELYEKQYR